MGGNLCRCVCHLNTPNFSKRKRPPSGPRRASIFSAPAGILARKGGDVDILVLSNPKLNWEEAARIRRRFWEQFGFQKLDLVCFSPEDQSAFKELVLLDAIRL